MVLSISRHTQGYWTTGISLQIWKSILTEEPDFASSAWKDVSGDAKDFVGLLLAKYAVACI